MVSAAVGGDKDNRLQKWADDLMDMAGWGLTEIEKASRETNKFLASRRSAQREKDKIEHQKLTIQKQRKELRDGEAKRDT